MELRNIKSFIKVAEFENFSKAAEVLRYTPSGVNQLVTALENELGFAPRPYKETLHDLAVWLKQEGKIA